MLKSTTLLPILTLALCWPGLSPPASAHDFAGSCADGRCSWKPATPRGGPHFLTGGWTATGYAAVAADPTTGDWGWSSGWESPERARWEALIRCGPSCNLVWSVPPGQCAAIARSANGTWGFAPEATRALAEWRAMAECRQRGQGCGALVWACAH